MSPHVKQGDAITTEYMNIPYSIFVLKNTPQKKLKYNN